MPSPLRARALRTLAAVMLLVALLVPGSAPALGADDEPLVLRAGTDQDLQVLNPWLSTSSSTTRSTRSTTTCSSVSGPTSNRCPASPTSGSRPPTA